MTSPRPARAEAKLPQAVGRSPTTPWLPRSQGVELRRATIPPALSSRSRCRTAGPMAVHQGRYSCPHSVDSEVSPGVCSRCRCSPHSRASHATSRRTSHTLHASEFRVVTTVRAGIRGLPLVLLQHLDAAVYPTCTRGTHTGGRTPTSAPSCCLSCTSPTPERPPPNSPRAFRHHAGQPR